MHSPFLLTIKHYTMRKRINRAAICSSENYKASKRLHLDYLNDKHQHFKEFTINGELAIDQPIIKDGNILPRFKTIRVFGKDMKVTIEEYNAHCKQLGL